ncbi:MAG: hypothetical protein RR140_02675 [Clostridia bacterium]
MKWFGTDGIRLENEKKLENISKQVAYALCCIGAKKIIVGRDTRPSGKQLLKTFCSSANSFGISCENIGVLPSSAVSFYTIFHEADFGVAITASHNPSNFNGIKIFDRNGKKINKCLEENIESYFNISNKQKNITPVKTKKICTKAYSNFLIANGKMLKNKTIFLDTANGAASKIAKKIFTELGANVKMFFCGSGKNINKNCGAVHPEILAKKIKELGANFGFAFDGDADRCVCVLSDGTVLNGDNVMFGLARCSGYKNVVGTILANGALDESFKKNNINFLRCDVGDREVLEAMEQNKIDFGGERSGHFIFKNILPTGDGIITALQILKCKDFFKKCKFKKIASVSKNVNSFNKEKDLQKLNICKKNCMDVLSNNGRLIIRPSGTESKIRILVEHKKLLTAKSIADTLENILKK